MPITEWKPIRTAPKDSTEVLLACVDEDDGTYTVRHGWYEPALNERCWYDIDDEPISPEWWMPLPAQPTSTPGETVEANGGDNG